MRAYRSLRNSWYPITVICLLSVIFLLRRDINTLRTKSKSQTSNSIHNDSLFFELVTKNKIKAVLSQSGEYVIYPDVRKPRRTAPLKNDVTFVTHCTYSNLRYLPHLTQTWNGPLSVAIFSSAPTKTLILIDLLRKCLDPIRNNVKFHLVTPLIKSPLELVGLAPGEPNIAHVLEHWHENKKHRNLICDNINSLLENLEQIEQNYELIGRKYPNNALRNVAWQYSDTAYVLNVDIDILPSFDLRTQFIQFVNDYSQKKESSSKTAFVIPVFEVEKKIYDTMKNTDNRETFTLNKKQIKKMISAGQARPFYVEVCAQCQNCTDYETWLNLKEKKGIYLSGIEFELKLPCEPFFILPRLSSPKFDERFKQYGYNRVSHVLEVEMAGWDFKVLDNAFLVHIGFKKGREDFHSSKDLDMQHNYGQFQNFQSELREKYKKKQLNDKL